MTQRSKELKQSTGYVEPDRARSTAYQKGWRMCFEGEWVNPYMECDDDHDEWEAGWEDSDNFFTHNTED